MTRIIVPVLESSAGKASSKSMLISGGHKIVFLQYVYKWGPSSHIFALKSFSESLFPQPRSFANLPASAAYNQTDITHPLCETSLSSQRLCQRPSHLASLHSFLVKRTASFPVHSSQGRRPAGVLSVASLKATYVVLMARVDAPPQSTAASETMGNMPAVQMATSVVDPVALSLRLEQALYP